jgi:hypothetical protein
LFELLVFYQARTAKVVRAFFCGFLQAGKPAAACLSKVVKTGFDRACNGQARGF